MRLRHPFARRASPAFPIQELLALRWSPFGFSDRPVADSDLRSLFEAARWAASAENEQPWTFIVATRSSPAEFSRLLSCLGSGNESRACSAPVLVLGVVNLRFARSNRDNPAAVHDLGVASANLVMEATARGLAVHQMSGVLPEKARDLYRIPEHSVAWSAMAIGYPMAVDQLPEALRAGQLAPRRRKPTSRFVFSGRWGHTSPLARQARAKVLLPAVLEGGPRDA